MTSVSGCEHGQRKTCHPPQGENLELVVPGLPSITESCLRTPAVFDYMLCACDLTALWFHVFSLNRKQASSPSTQCMYKERRNE